MPLRDHFRDPAAFWCPWYSFFSVWTTTLLTPLNEVLPDEFRGGPHVRAGTRDERFWFGPEPADPLPTATVRDEFDDEHIFQLEIEDMGYGRLAAVVMFVCPAHKDRPAARRAFAATAAATLRRTGSIVVVDIGTDPSGNLFAETLALCGVTDPPLGLERSKPYAVSARRREMPGRGALLDVWAHQLEYGRPLSTLPVWLRDELCVPLDLEASYERSCRALRIP